MRYHFVVVCYFWELIEAFSDKLTVIFILYFSGDNYSWKIISFALLAIILLCSLIAFTSYLLHDLLFTDARMTTLACQSLPVCLIRNFSYLYWHFEYFSTFPLPSFYSHIHPLLSFYKLLIDPRPPLSQFYYILTIVKTPIPLAF